MKKSLPIIFMMVLALGLVQCKKKSTDTPAPSTVCTNLSGTKNSYLPNTTGTWWKYKGAQNYTTSVGCDTVIGGKTYTRFNNSNSSEPSFCIKSGTTYTTVTFSTIPKYVSLKDETVGTTWTNYYPNLIFSYDYRYEMELTNSGFSKVVNGVTFNDVVEVRQDIFIDTGGGYSFYQTDYYYYAYGVGFIQADLSNVGTVYLDSYSIK